MVANLIGFLFNLPFAVEGDWLSIIATILFFIAYIYVTILYAMVYLITEAISGDEYIAIQGGDPNDYILVKADEVSPSDTVIVSTGTDDYETAVDRVEKYLDGLYGAETN